MANRKKLIIGIVAVAIVLAAALMGLNHFGLLPSFGGMGGDVAYVQKVSTISNYTLSVDRFSGVVESQKAINYKKDPERKIEEVYVKVGDVVKKAKDKGIRVISYDRLIRSAGTDLYISFDNTRVGTLMGEALAEALPEGGRVFQIQGSASDNNVSMIREGFEEALQGTGIEIVYSTFCDNWLAELAFDAVNEGLDQNGGTIDGVMCGNDDLAGQAIRALTEHKLAGEIPVVAQDAELSACQRIMEGTQTMTVYKSVDKEAQTAAKFAVALAKGEDITDTSSDLHTEETISDGQYDIPYYPLEPAAVTRENMDEVIIEGGFHQREDVYLNVE